MRPFPQLLPKGRSLSLLQGCRKAGGWLCSYPCVPWGGTPPAAWPFRGDGGDEGVFVVEEAQPGSLGFLCSRELLPCRSGQGRICLQMDADSGIWLISASHCLSSPSQGWRINLATFGLLPKSA